MNFNIDLKNIDLKNISLEDIQTKLKKVEKKTWIKNDLTSYWVEQRSNEKKL